MYKKTQYGSVIIFAFLIILGFMTVLMVNLVNKNFKAFIILEVVGFIFLLMLLLFFRLSVKIENKILTVRFGIGFIRFKFNLEEIVSCKKVRNRWYYGFGIRLTPHGWLYNISGLDAVEIEKENGKKYRIGTKEPEKLCNEINSVINKNS